MSVFKRLGNVARGKMLEFGKGEGAPSPTPDELDPPRPPPRRTAERAASSTDDKRVMLEKLKEEGLLTDEEFAEKMADLAAPTSDRPKKRFL